MQSGYRGLLAIVLSLGVLFLWYTFIAPPLPPQKAPGEVPATLLQSNGKASGVSAAEAPQHKSTSIQKGSRHLAEGEKRILENGEIKVTLDTAGGVIKDWQLKRYSKNGPKNGKAEAVGLADVQSVSLSLDLQKANILIPDPIPFQIERETSTELVLHWRSKDLEVWKKFSLGKEAYQLQTETEFLNRKNKTISFMPTIGWSKIPTEESPQRGFWVFKSPPDVWHPVYFKDNSLESQQASQISSPQTLSGKIAWAGAESRYFLGTVIPRTKEAIGLELAKFSLGAGESSILTRLLFEETQILPGERWIQKLHIYGGPKDLKYLKPIQANLDKSIGYGWTSWIAIPLLVLLQLFYRLIHNYGIAIILLTVLVKILLNPINRKSLQSMKAMQALQPKLKELQKKYGSDKQRVQMETMQLFKTHKVNPMGGCLPMLLQFPIYIALYNVLWNSVELYHAPFFWFYKDLSAPDPYLITPILLGITMIIQTKMTPQTSVDPTQQKAMMLMPIFFSAIMLFLPMGLVLYILVNTLMTILQQWMYQKGIRFRDLLRGRIIHQTGQ